MMAAFALLLVVFSSCYLLSEGKTINPSSRMLLDKVENVKRIAKQYMHDNKLAFAPSADYPYWNFLPQHVGTFIPGGDSVEWSSPCFGSNKAKAQFTSDNTAIEITVVSSKPTTSDGHCEDTYAALSTAATSWFNSIHTNRLHSAVTTTITYTLPSDITDSETWDVQTKGVRFFRYLLPVGETLSNLIVTLETFAPEQLPDVPKKFADMGIDFMSKYAHFDVVPRDPALNRIPDESEVKSGDSFYLMRFDGLNPLLAWAMGSTTGHVTTALWIDGELYVCESTVDSAYWPTDDVQRTPYRTWINQTIAADFQVVYVKLNDEARKRYNETAAVEFFKQSEGLDYGFKAIMWGWLDTEKDNLPCLPPDFSSNCFQWELLEPVLAHADRVDNDVGNLIWNPGFAKRLGLPDDNTKRTADLYRETARQSMTTSHVLTIPEQDTWLYNTTRYGEPAVGRVMVCCVFVCSTWKAAGVFGDLTDQINCAEQTNWDDYVLTIHQDKFEQIVGTYSLDLNNFHTKDPYAHMAETCPSLAPDYKKPADC